MKMEDVTLAEQHVFKRDEANSSHLKLLDMAYRCVKLVEDLREQHGHDSVVINKPFTYLQSEQFGAKFFGVEWVIQCDADRIKIERPPVASA